MTGLEFAAPIPNVVELKFSEVALQHYAWPRSYAAGFLM
jgi:hypothetical protein